MELENEQLPSVSYDDVLTKIALRHPAQDIKSALEIAIAQEEAEFKAATDDYESALAEFEQKQAEQTVSEPTAQEVDAAELNTETVLEVPLEAPQAPVLDMTKRRACYEKQYVNVDLAVTTTEQDAYVEYDDEALVAKHYPATIAHTQEQIAAVERARFKADREAELANLKVEVEGLCFDADELSQQRMAKTILVMNDTDQVNWVLADNSVEKVTKAQLFQACQAATLKQTSLWVK